MSENYIKARAEANNPLVDEKNAQRVQEDALLEESNKGFWADIEQGIKEAPWQIAGGIADFTNETWQFMGLNSAAEWVNDRLPDAMREMSDELRGGELTEDVVPTTEKAESTTGGFIRGMSQFMTGFIPILGQVNKLKWASKGGKVTQAIKKGTIAGAPVDFAGFDPNDPNAANALGAMLDGHPEMQRIVLDYLGTQSDDPAVFNRFKNAFVGAALGVVAEPVVAGGKALGKATFNKMAKAIREYKIARATAKGKADLQITDDELGIDMAEVKPRVVPDTPAQPSKPVDPVDTKVETPKPAGEIPRVYTDRGIQKPFLSVKPEKLDQLEEAFTSGDYRGQLDNTDINFDFIKSTEDAKDVINTFSNLDGADKAKVTFKETEELASHLGTSIKNVNETYLKTKGLASRVLAARRVMVASAEHMFELASKAELSGTAEDALKVRKQALIHSGFQKELSGIKTEIARSLNAMKIEASGADAKLAQIDALVTSFGGRDNLDKFIASVNHLAKQEDAAFRLGQFTKRGATARTVDAILEAYITGLLWNPKTQIVNFLGNTSASVLGVLERRYAENINPKTGKLQLRRNRGEGVVAGEAHAMLQGLREGYREAWDLALKTWKDDAPATDALVKTDVYKPHEKAISADGLHMKGNIGKYADYLGNFLRLSTRSLMSADEFFKTINYRMHLHSLAHRRAQGLNLTGKDYEDALDEIMRNPEPELHMEAMDFARYNTFTEDLAKGSRSKQIQQIIENDGNHPGGAVLKGVLKSYIPFFRTPVNLLRFSAERTPALRVLSKRLRDQMASGDAATRQLAEAKLATGNSIFLMTLGMAQSGLITGAPPSDKELNANQRRRGWKPYSIVIPHQVNPFSDVDVYIPYNRFDPVGMTIGMTADYWQASTMLINGISRARDEGFHDLVQDDLADAASMMVLSTVNNLEERAYMQGLANVIEIYKNPEKAAKQMVSVVPPLSFMSAAVRGVTRTIDPVKRITDDDTIFKEIRNTIYRNIPGLSQELPADRDLEGNKQFYPGNGTNILWNGFNNLVNPATPSSITDSTVDRRVQELKVEIVDIRGTRAVEFQGIRVDLDSEQIDFFGQIWGTMNKNLDMSQFDTGNDIVDRTNLKATLIKTKNAAKEVLLEQFPEIRERAATKGLRLQLESSEQDSPLFNIGR